MTAELPAAPTTPPTALPALGRYEVLCELGRGAMGVVYKARDPMLDRLVAIKTVNMALEENGKAQYDVRFQQEARAAGGLNHPGIVTVHDIGKSGDIAFLAMEYIEGVELRAMLQGQPLPVSQAVALAAQIAEALAYAHQHGVVHRDIKPPNIMVLPNGVVKITDFGIARMRSSLVQTQTGIMMGSPRYMSPEQVTGQRADHRSDLFSLGIILYEMLVGAVPFAGDSMTALMYQIVNFAPPAPSAVRPGVPEMLDVIVAKLLAKPLEARYQDAAELARDLRACERSLPAGAAEPAAAQGAAALSPSFDIGAQTVVLAQPAALSRASDAAAATAPETPARGVARGFDSYEATMRLASLTVAAPAGGGPTPVPADPTVLRPVSQRWRLRDSLALAVAGAAGLVAGYFIM